MYNVQYTPYSGQKDKRTKRQKDKKTKGQKDKRTKGQMDKRTKGQKEKIFFKKSSKCCVASQGRVGSC